MRPINKTTASRRTGFRKIAASLTVMVLLFVMLFFISYVTLESDHDCCGEECPVCVQLRQCVANFHLTGSGIEADTTAVSLPVFAADAAIPAEVQLPILSLVSQKVQFNE